MLLELSLDSNQLSGPLPTEWTSLSLEEFSVAQNRLTGPVDAGWQEMSTLLTFDVRMNALDVSSWLGGQLPVGWQLAPQANAPPSPDSSEADVADEKEEIGGNQEIEDSVGAHGIEATMDEEMQAHADADARRLLALRTSPHSHSSLLETWQEDTDHCQWHGVSCTADGSRRVWKLVLDGLGLTGPLPDAWSGLAKLESLHIKFNNGLSGQLPASWSQLTSLSSL